MSSTLPRLPHCRLGDDLRKPLLVGGPVHLDDLSHARDAGGLDFFALTDHGEMIDVWPWEEEWQEVLDAANATNQNGTFVALWGFEWSNPVLGHINILNTTDNTGAVSTFDLSAIYDWLAARPPAIGRCSSSTSSRAPPIGASISSPTSLKPLASE